MPLAGRNKDPACQGHMIFCYILLFRKENPEYDSQGQPAGDQIPDEAKPRDAKPGGDRCRIQDQTGTDEQPDSQDTQNETVGCTADTNTDILEI